MGKRGAICNSRQDSAGQRAGKGAPSGGSGRKLYSEVLANKTYTKKFKLTVKSNEHLPTDTIKDLLKTKINPIEIKVGINSFKSLKKWEVLIETKSKEELEALQKNINDKCEGKPKANIFKLRNPRLVIIIPEEISIGNVQDIPLAQNKNISLWICDIEDKFNYETKKHTRNLVIEVSAQTRKVLLERRVKLGCQICRIEDYVVATRCYKCSRYNHRARD